METDVFFQKIETYAKLTTASKLAWTALLQEKVYLKGAHFTTVGQVPRKVAFVVEGLFSQYYITNNGDKVIKYFFPEGRIAGSVPAILDKKESTFGIEALEKTMVLEYDYHAFKKLVSEHHDIARFYIRYIEQHWIIDKEPMEIALRNDTAHIQYAAFLDKYPELAKRLKKHQIASYLGITPTQLSRIFGYSK